MCYISISTYKYLKEKTKRAQANPSYCEKKGQLPVHIVK